MSIISIVIGINKKKEIDMHMCINSIIIGIKKEKEICLQNKEYISFHRYERINMAVKCRISMNYSKT